MKKPLLFTLLLFCFTCETNAQVDEYLQERYANFRERFRKEFVVIGTERGMSIPIERRVLLQDAEFSCSIAGIENRTVVFWNDNGITLKYDVFVKTFFVV